MKILVTGADGFTGRHFASLVESRGHTFVALQSDLTDPGALEVEISAIEPSHVLHLAAISFVGHADERAFYGVNLFGTMNLLDALAKLARPPNSVILASSANVYGNCATSPITEMQLPAPTNHYGISKLAMEHAARMYMDTLSVVVARPFNYTGPGQHLRFVIPKLVDHFARRAPEISLGNLDVEREFNDVQMICDAYLQLLQHGEAGEAYNVCSGRPYTLMHVVNTLKSITGHDIDVQVNPEFVRANEVRTLCGSPDKLDSLMTRHGVSLFNPTLAATLEQMLRIALQPKRLS